MAISFRWSSSSIPTCVTFWVCHSLCNEGHVLPHWEDWQELGKRQLLSKKPEGGTQNSDLVAQFGAVYTSHTSNHEIKRLYQYRMFCEHLYAKYVWIYGMATREENWGKRRKRKEKEERNMHPTEKNQKGRLARQKQRNHLTFSILNN